jgi:hypothetical protein
VTADHIAAAAPADAPTVVSVAAADAGDTGRAGPGDAAEPRNTIVEMSIFGRSVRVEAHQPLPAVAAAATSLWQSLADHPVQQPYGTSGFVISDPVSCPPDTLEHLRAWPGRHR